jgi:uncharacterized protein YecT (DUF1311 family)
MKIGGIMVAVMTWTALTPPTAAAQATVADSYIEFAMSDRQAKAMQSRAFKACVKQWVGSTGGTRQCFAAEMPRAEQTLEAAYNQKVARLDSAARVRLAGAQQLWLENRFAACNSAWDAESGGTLRNIVYDECTLRELQRRTLWLRNFK